MPDFDRLVRERRSVRDFRPTPVPREALAAALETAQHAPSNSNIQPWSVVVVEGRRRDELAAALTEYVEDQGYRLAALPEEFEKKRQAAGVQIYGSMGVARGDQEARTRARLRNFNFFGAPTAAIVGVDARLGLADAASVGMYLQTLALALYARGVDTCMQVAPAMFPEVIRPTLGIPEDIRLVCAVSIGYRNPSAPANSVRLPRDPVENNVRFLE